MPYETSTDDRRTRARRISEQLQIKTHYQGPPTFAYAVGPVMIDREGSITCEDEKTFATLRPFLEEWGYIEPETAPDSEPASDTLSITVPIAGFEFRQLWNLMHILHRHQYLLNRITRRESFFLSETMLTRLGEQPTENLTDFEAITADFKAQGELIGVDFKDSAVTLTFPMAAAPEKNAAYADLAAAIVKAARVSARGKVEVLRPSNEKYVIRAWLLRLGFGGLDFKASRRALLNGLKGHCAFSSDAEAEKHRDRYAEFRRIAKATKEGEIQ
jgi:hypothetical protein